MKFLPYFMVLLLLFNYFSLVPYSVSSDETPEPYITHYAPPNSFGIPSIKAVNWTYFRQLFNQHIDWTLEYKRYSYSPWTYGNQYMTIEKTWNDDGFWKFNLIFDVPVDVYEARFTFLVNIPVLDYVNRSGAKVWLNYTVPNTQEVYRCHFDWTDLLSIPDLYFQKGKLNNKWYFRFGRQNIPAGHYEFDPWFGEQGTSAMGSTIENSIRGTNFTCPASATADNITAYLYISANSKNVKCAIYNSSDVFVGETEERTLSAGGATWYTFEFSDPKPTLNVGEMYTLCAWSSSAVGSSLLMLSSVAGFALFDSETYNGFPDPANFAQLADDKNFSIYCSYTESAAGWSNTAPSVHNPGPANGTTGVSLYPRLNVTVTDDDGNSSKCTWSTNASGSWSNYQVNTSVLNASIQDINASWASSYGKKYFWRVYANDTHDNTSSDIFNFVTVTEVTPYVNTPPTITNPIPSNGSWDISLTPRLNVTITDADGNASKITWSTNESGSWVNYQVNTSVLNTSVADPVASYVVTQNKRYYWRVYANDGHDNVSEVFHFNTVNYSWTNTLPVSSGETPTNKSTNVNISIGYWNVTINDADGNTTSGSIECSNGNTTTWSGQANGTRSLTLDVLNYSVNYTVWLNFTDGHGNVNETYWFITESAPSGPWTDTIPNVTSVYPVNNSIDISIATVCRVYIGDVDGNASTVMWFENSTGSWVHRQTNTSVLNGTTHWNYTQATAYNTTYYWRIYVNDTNSNNTYWFNFTTGVQPSVASGPISLSVTLFVLLIWMLIVYLEHKSPYQYVFISFSLGTIQMIIALQCFLANYLVASIADAMLIASFGFFLYGVNKIYNFFTMDIEGDY